MEKIQNSQFSHYKTTFKTRVVAACTVLIMSLILSSCSAIGEIFKAGMSFGIFIVLAIIVVVAILFLRFGKRKNS